VISKIVDYLEVEFKDCLRRSSHKNGNHNRNCALLFEVKMDSKKLNREPTLFTLLQTYRQTSGYYSNEIAKQIEEELDYVKSIDLDM
jgi:hypothetical protein